MREISFAELSSINGGAWCTWDGHPSSGAANKIWIEDGDCTVLKKSIQTNQGGFDTFGMIMTAVFAWSGAIVGLAASYAFGLGTITAAGVCFVFAISVGAGYAAAHR